MNCWVAGHILLPLHERLMRRKTFAYYRELLESQWWPSERLAELQLAKLRRLVDIFATRTAYAKLAGIDSSFRPQGLDDLRRLPTLDKRFLNAHREDLTNPAVPGGPIRYNTGGSSGNPLIFHFDRRRQAYDKAARMRTHQWWDVGPGDREAYVWGSPVELKRQDRVKRVRDWLTNEMLLSAFDLSERNAGPFVAALRRFRPRSLFGYPSSIALLCQLTRRQGLRMDDLGVKVVFSTAEVLYDHQKQLIGETLGNVPVVNGYGSREGGFISHECPGGSMHLTEENLIVEFLQGDQPAPPGQDGEIVLTHLDNHAMPFIRYRTGDIGSALQGPCRCGRGLRRMNIIKGRTTDFIIAPDGRWVHGLALIYVVRALPGVRQYQIVQEDVNHLLVKLVLEETFPSDGPQQVIAGMQERLGRSVRVDVAAVDSIPTEASGKFSYVVSQAARDRQALL